MEDIDGGLHPAVDGQSLDEMMMSVNVRDRLTDRFIKCSVNLCGCQRWLDRQIDRQTDR